MSEDLVVIRVYHSELDAGVAQAELKAAGIHSLLYAESGPTQAGPGTPSTQQSTGVGLAVHKRDAEVAAALLQAYGSA